MQRKILKTLVSIITLASTVVYAKGTADFNGSQGLPFQYLQQQINSIQTDQSLIVTLQARVTELENAIYSLQTQMDAATGDISDLQSQMSALQEEVAMTNANLAALQGALEQGCPAGYTIRRITQDGTVLCETAAGTSTGTSATLNLLSRSSTVYVPPGNLLLGGTQASVSAICPTGYVATGGGYMTVPSPNLYVVQSSSYYTAGWSGKIVSKDTSTQPFTVYVNCAKVQ